MRVLVACECSGVVRDAFTARGHDAWSCDIVPAERNHSVQHIRADVLTVLDQGWDLMIAHPPCTYLSYAANRVWNEHGRPAKRRAAMEFFMALWAAAIPRVCIENPFGYPVAAFRKPDQTVNPFNFGHPERKRTCLWLRGLPKLEYVDPVDPPKPDWVGENRRMYWTHRVRGSRKRSRTFPGIAAAMADQWGSL